MTKIQKALVCIDLSDYSKMTMDYALSVARGFMTELVLLNVINNRDVYAVTSVSLYYPEKFDVELYLKKVKADRRKQIREMMQEHFPSDMNQMNILIRVGVPFQEIIKVIEEEKIDLVILGNKGKGNLLGTLFGSNAEKVFRHSPVPVLSVRDRARFGRN
jgi:nucleotide-binding universal stress UspA family protein